VTFWVELCTSYGSSCYHHFNRLSSNKLQNGTG